MFTLGSYRSIISTKPYCLLDTIFQIDLSYDIRHLHKYYVTTHVYLVSACLLIYRQGTVPNAQILLRKQTCLSNG
jgi:hypothetical protein